MVANKGPVRHAIDDYFVEVDADISKMSLHSLRRVRDSLDALLATMENVEARLPGFISVGDFQIQRLRIAYYNAEISRRIPDSNMLVWNKMLPPGKIIPCRPRYARRS